MRIIYTFDDEPPGSYLHGRDPLVVTPKPSGLTPEQEQALLDKMLAAAYVAAITRAAKAGEDTGEFVEQLAFMQQDIRAGRS